MTRQADLFLGLAQRRLHQRGVAGVGAATGESDLAPMAGEVVGALREQYVPLIVVPIQWNQHCRWARLPLGAGEGGARSELSAERLDKLGHAQSIA